MKRTLSLSSNVSMYLKKFLARFVGLTVAGVVSAAKIRFAPRRVNHSINPQIKEVNMSFIKKFVAFLGRLNLAGSLSAVQKLFLVNLSPRKRGAGMQLLFLTLTLMVTAFWVSPAVGAEKKMVTDPTTGEMVSAPEYGGTITYPYISKGATTDPFITGTYVQFLINGVNEQLAWADWGIDRDVWEFSSGFHFRGPALTGMLAERWFSNPTQPRSSSISARAFTGRISHRYPGAS